MNVNDPKIDNLRTLVKAACQEFDMAIMFHEVWKSAAYDEGLHNRMGVSYAANAFHVVRAVSTHCTASISDGFKPSILFAINVNHASMECELQKDTESI